jgi:hypothetical protein
MAFNINGTTGLTFNNGSAQEVGGVGTGSQTWQSVISSRALNTSYTNTTGKPIMVNVAAFLNGIPQSGVSLLVNNITVAQNSQNTAGGNTGIGATLSAVVPNGSVYLVTGASSLYYWAELR